MSAWKDLFIEIPGEPVGKGRPRFNTQTHRAYTPGKTAKYEALIRMTFHEKYPEWTATPYPVKIYIRAEYTVPESWPMRKKLLTWLNITPHKTSKPDLDNILKAALDALNKVVWLDDAQVVQIGISKAYEARNRLLIHIEECKPDEKLTVLSTKELKQMLKEQEEEDEQD